MNRFDRLLQLKRLYQLKSVGCRYDDPPANTQLLNASHLPDSLELLKESALTCSLCELSKTRKHVVFGEGSPQADLMLIGEGPGAMEDETGRPFVGRAGELLTNIIHNVLEIPRESVYIANIVKCRPPGNRVPTPSEASACKPFLFKQIQQIQPKLIVALGATSYHYLTEDKTPISKIRGVVQEFERGIKLIPTFHPSYLLRNPSAKKEAYQDFLKVKSCL